MTRRDELWHDPERNRELACADLKIPLDQPGVDPTKVAAIGCFGGYLVLAWAGTNLAVVVGFHPGWLRRDHGTRPVSPPGLSCALAPRTP